VRILYLHQYFVPPDGPGGTRSYEFARRWIDMGHDVCLITSSAYMPEPYRSFDRITALNIAGIPAVVIPLAYSNAMSFPSRIRAFVRFAFLASREAMRHPADVVFATSAPLTIAIPGLAARLRYRIPLVFEVRDLWPEKPIAMGALRNPVARALARSLEWIAYHAATHVVALSPGAVSGIKRRGIPAGRISVIPNSCDLDLFDVPAERGQPIRARLGLTADQPLIVYTGAFGYVNGVGYAVEMAKTLAAIAPEVHILLIGSGVEKDQVIAQAAGSGVLNRNLIIWDPVPKNEMPDVLAAATMATSFVIAVEALWDNSANKFFDGLAAGKPVAINHGGWQADLLDESGAGIVLPPGDPAQAARQLAAFVRDADRLRAAGEAARQLARTRFDRDGMARQLEAILRSAVDRKRP
jgi:glycosyltransferase involved in cell wall biosynthesis